jgi:hypothetical protein
LAVNANERVRDALPAVIDSFVTVGERAPYHQFAAKLAEWVQLADADGSHRDADLAHERRHASLTTVGKVTYLDARFDSLTGDVLRDILTHFEQAEFAADWAATIDRYGGDAAADLMPRSPDQRRADAIVAIFRQAASTDPTTAVAPLPLVNLVSDQAVYEEQLAALIEGRRVVFDTADRPRCATTSGVVVDPAVAVAASVIGHVRRIVVDSTGRVVDVGRKRRTFTTGARDGALIQAVLDATNGRCLWPGCGHHRTQLDHIDEWQRDRGPSDLANTSWFCAFHNALKTHGFRTWRDADGIWHLVRPDGSEISAA